MRDLGECDEASAGKAFAPITAGLLPLTARGIGVMRHGKALLAGVCLTVAAGSPTVIMGPNGAGKSLLLRVLHGLVAPTSGSVVWGSGVNADVAGRRSALVFQRPTLLRRSALANVEFVLAHRPRAKRRQSAQEILEQAGLGARARVPARQLSGGASSSGSPWRARSHPVRRFCSWTSRPPASTRHRLRRSSA